MQQTWCAIALPFRIHRYVASICRRCISSRDCIVCSSTVIKDEFDRLGGSDLNAVQALLLYNMGDNELTAGELKSRGFYMGSNVSYNLKKLVEMGYIDYERSESDRRSVRVSLSAKGRQASDVVQKLYQRQLGSVETVGQVSGDEFKSVNKSLARLERFWSDQIRYRL